MRTASRRNLSHAPITAAGEVQSAPSTGCSLVDRFAEELANLGDITAASIAIRVPEGVGQQLFASICRRLGDQAQ
jgi:hypothetical protein